VYDPSTTLLLTASTYQSFTAGISGELSQIDIRATLTSIGNRDLNFSIWNSNGDTLLGGINIDYADLNSIHDGGYLQVDFSATGIMINSGNVYVIEMTHNPGQYFSANFLGNPGNEYLGGSRLIRDSGGSFVETDGDMSFRTYVATVPLPAAAWLFGSGLLGLFGVSRRKIAA
jgi:hypothetical protein